MERKIEVLWLGVTPLEQTSERTKLLCRKYVGNMLKVNFPDNTSGMETYEEWQNALGMFNVIATDDENIDASWENFFEAKNWGKCIYQFKDSEWQEVKPGFSKNHARN